MSFIYSDAYAAMLELVDRLGWGPSGGFPVRVRVSLAAPLDTFLTLQNFMVPYGRKEKIMKKIFGMIIASLMFSNVGFSEIRKIEEKRIDYSALILSLQLSVLTATSLLFISPAVVLIWFSFMNGID